MEISLENLNVDHGPERVNYCNLLPENCCWDVKIGILRIGEKRSFTVESCI